MAQGLEVAQVAARAAAKIQDIERPCARKLAQELFIILGDIVILCPLPRSSAQRQGGRECEVETRRTSRGLEAISSGRIPAVLFVGNTFLSTLYRRVTNQLRAAE